MKRLAQLIEKNKKVSLICLFLLIVFVGCSATSAINVAHRRAEKTQTSTETTGTTDTGTDKDDELSKEISLTDSQKTLIEGYDDDTEEFIETLCASLWSANGGNDTVRFSGESYTETVNGSAETHSYAVSRLERSASTSGLDIVTAVFETDDGTHIVTYTNDRGTDGEVTGEVQSTLTSSTMFSLADSEYVRTDSVENISIKGMNSAVTALFDDNTDDLISGLSAWCAVYYPTATEATWSQEAYISWQESTIYLTFELNTESAVSVSVDYDMNTGQWNFSY